MITKLKEKLTSKDVTLAVMNYNGAERLPGLFESIERLEQPPGELMIVDDGSTDGGAELMQARYPEVKVISMGRNTKVLNMVRNRAFHAASKRLVFIVDNDVELHPDCVKELLHAMNTLPKAAACITRAVYWDQPDVIYQDGQILHYVGASPGPNRNRLVKEVDAEPRLSIGWGVQMIDREAAEEVGFFNEEYLLGWGDDGEINHKLNLAGYRCYQIPKAVVLHKREESSKRYLAAVRNRLRFILEMYQWRTILLALPAFVVYEAALVSFIIMKGSIKDYFRGWGYFLTHIPGILRTRRTIQASRMLRDSDVMEAGDIFVYSDYIDKKILAFGYTMLNKFLNGYWRLIRPLV